MIPVLFLAEILSTVLVLHMVLIAVLWGDIITPAVTNNFRHYTVLVLHMVLIAVPVVTNNFRHYTAHGTDSCTCGNQ
jgi:hypothetical protein